VIILKARKQLRLILIVGLIGYSLIAFYSLITFNKDGLINNTEEKIKEKEKEKIKTYNLSLIMVGDALIHKSVYNDAYVGNNVYDFKKMFEDIKPIIKEYDLAFYNQESIIGGKDLGISGYPLFNAPDEIGDAMLDMGFNIVSLANNHTLDKKEEGIRYSLNYWKNKDVMTAGSYGSEEDRVKDNIKTKNNISYSLLAYTVRTNGLKVPTGKDYLVNVYDKEKVRADIERIRDKVDVLIVSMHWGSEYTNTPTYEEKEIAEYLSSLGVDIVIGHHPHVVQPIDYINKTLVIYSLGNFVSAQDTTNKLTGLMASLNIEKIVDKDDITINIKDVKGTLIYTYYKNWRNFKVIPYSKLNNSLLSNYQSNYETYSNIVKQYRNEITVDPLEE
jgi:poly-gamma-glutamate synthesis protein (capsule biosynthesis protein)